MLRPMHLLALSIVLAAPVLAHPQSFRYGPLEGFTQVFVSDHPHTDFLITVSPDLPMSGLFRLCLITEHADGRDVRDETCGETVQCSVDASACDDMEDIQVRACSGASITSQLAIYRVRVEIEPTYLDEASGAFCSSGPMGQVALDMY